MELFENSVTRQIQENIAGNASLHMNRLNLVGSQSEQTLIDNFFKKCQNVHIETKFLEEKAWIKLHETRSLDKRTVREGEFFPASLEEWVNVNGIAVTYKNNQQIIPFVFLNISHFIQLVKIIGEQESYHEFIYTMHHEILHHLETHAKKVTGTFLPFIRPSTKSSPCEDPLLLALTEDFVNNYPQYYDEWLTIINKRRAHGQ